MPVKAEQVSLIETIALTDLDDVTITSPTQYDHLELNGSSEWVNTNILTIQTVATDVSALIIDGTTNTYTGSGTDTQGILIERLVDTADANVHAGLTVELEGLDAANVITPFLRGIDISVTKSGTATGNAAPRAIYGTYSYAIDDLDWTTAAASSLAVKLYGAFHGSSITGTYDANTKIVNYSQYGTNNYVTAASATFIDTINLTQYGSYNLVYGTTSGSGTNISIGAYLQAALGDLNYDLMLDGSENIALDNTGSLTLVSTKSGGNLEDLKIDLEDTADTVVLSSSTGVTALDYSALNLTTTGTVTQSGLPCTVDGLEISSLRNFWAFKYATGLGADNTGVLFNLVGSAIEWRLADTPFMSLTTGGNLTTAGSITGTEGFFNGGVNIGSSEARFYIDSTHTVVRSNTTDAQMKFIVDDGAAKEYIVLDPANDKIILLSGIPIFSTGTIDFQPQNTTSSGVRFENGSGGSDSARIRVIENGGVLDISGAASSGGGRAGVKIGNANALSTAGDKIVSFYSDGFTTEVANIGYLGGAYFASDVGIGVTPPTDRLTVYNDTDGQAAIRSHNPNTGVSAKAVIYTSAGTNVTSLFHNSYSQNNTTAHCGITLSDWNEILSYLGDGLLIDTATAAPIVFGTNNVEAMRIDSSQKVGIGTGASVDSILHTYEDSASSGNSSTGIWTEQDGAGDAVIGWLLTSAERWMMGIDNDDGDKLKIDESNTLGTNTYMELDPAVKAVTVWEKHIIISDDTVNPTLSLITTNTAHQVDLYLDENVGGDSIYFKAQTAGVIFNTVFQSQSGQSSYLYMSDGTDTVNFGRAAGGAFLISCNKDESDISFQVDSAAGDVTALTLDASDAGTAIFSHDIKIADDAYIGITSDTDLLQLKSAELIVNGDLDVTGISQVATPVIHLTKTSSQNVGGAIATETYITWQTQSKIDTDFFTHSTSSNTERIYVDVAGRYSIIATIGLDSAGAARTVSVARFRIDGSTQVVRGGRRGYCRGSNYGNFTAHLNTEVDLTAGQYIEIYHRVDDTDASYTVDTIVAECEVIIRKVGD